MSQLFRSLAHTHRTRHRAHTHRTQHRNPQTLAQPRSLLLHPPQPGEGAYLNVLQLTVEMEPT